MIHARALGPVELTVDGHAPPPELLWRKHIALLMYLALSPRRTRTREHLTGLLWGEKPESAARHSLREAIRAIRHAAGDGLVEAHGDQVRLPEGALTCDVDTFDRLATNGDWNGASALALGEFMEGFAVPDAAAFEDWLAAERLRIRGRELDVLVRRSEELQRHGDLTASAECASRALALDPVSNAATRAFMTAVTLTGDRAAALAAYERLRSRMRDGLGAEPDEPTRRLAEQVRRERVWPERRAIAVRDAALSRRTPLAGRDEELARLLDLFSACAAGRAQVAIIEGPSGGGKTRLAEELVSRARLAGAATATVRGTPADQREPWSGVWGLARGGLAAVPGVGAASPQALAAFAARLEDWGDAFAGAHNQTPLSPGRALAEVVCAAAAEQPVLLLADDAHWLDHESLEALHALVRDAAQAPVLVIHTASPQPAREELDVMRSRLGREVPGAVVKAEPLGPAPLRQLARWAMPAYGEVEVDRLARRIAVESAGLPLLAVELLHAVALGLDLAGAPHAWPEPHRTLDQTLPGELPETVVAAIRIGYRRLGKNAQALLAAASVLGERAGTAELGRVSGLEGEALAAALDEAEWQRWLVADGRGYRFVARIAREVIASDMMTEGQRRRLRERAQAPP